MTVAKYLGDIAAATPFFLSLLTKSGISNEVEVSVSHRSYGRYMTFLPTALAETGPIGIRLGGVGIARSLLQSDLANRALYLSPARFVFGSARLSNARAIDIDYNFYAGATDAQTQRLPYFAHPEFYRSGWHRIVKSTRCQERIRRIFFAGTANATAYREKFRFPIMSRSEIFETVFLQFRGRIGVDLASSDKIIMITTDNPSDKLSKHVLNQNQYIECMSRSNFFLCPPGWLMPHSHNIIEAMSCGAIPITNYGDFMDPPLIHGVNSLRFETRNQLVEAFDIALAMPLDRIEWMRRKVVEYYETHLDPVCVGNMLRARLPSISRLLVNDESGR